MAIFSKILSGLAKTRENIMSGVESALSGFTVIDEELFEQLEEALITSDVGVETSMHIVEQLRGRVKAERATAPEQIKGLLAALIAEILNSGESGFELGCPAVILMVGVNGVGKTTTIGKLAYNYRAQGLKVLIAAGDTFRAAAIDQLQVWGEWTGTDVIRHQENSDPAAVVFDAVQAAKARSADLLICDTAGRLHNKKNLMEELKKILRIISQNYPEARLHVFLTLDATTGQNALQQAKVFKEAVDINGLVLTKLDGTAKGGIIIAIKNELKVPVRFIGVGEGVDDLQDFVADDYAKAIFM